MTHTGSSSANCLHSQQHSSKTRSFFFNASGVPEISMTQSYGGGFLAFALVGASGAVALFFVGKTWKGTFV